MATALLAAIRRDDSGRLRALVPLAGRSVLGWQIDFARSQGCDRIMCLCEQAEPEILVLQREVEASGGEFHLVRSNVQLVALMRSGDPVIMLLDGLVPDPAAKAVENKGQGRLKREIVALPSDAEVAKSLPHDFERIDAQRSWAGIAVFDASTVAKLGDYPPDSEPMSLLLRLALQDGVPCRMERHEAGRQSGPVLAVSREALHTHEQTMINAHGQAVGWSVPFVALAQIMARRGILGGDRLPAWLVPLAALAALVSAGLLIWYGQGGFALIAAAIGVFGAQCAVAKAELVASLHRNKASRRLARLFAPLADTLAIVALLMALHPVDAPVERLVLPVLAIGLARIAGQMGVAGKATFWDDRALHLAGFGIAAIAGMLAPALAVFGIGALAHKLLQPLAK